MSVLDNALQEEYERSKKIKAAMERELEQLPIGYISQKNINNRKYCYLQKRQGIKIVGNYIPSEDLPKLKAQVERRMQLEKSIKELKKNMKKIERVIKR